MTLGWNPTSKEHDVNTINEFVTAPSIIGLTNGDSIVSWYSFDRKGLFGQVLDDQGLPQGDEILMTTSSFPVERSLTPLDGSRFLISWSTQAFNDDWDIFGMIYDANGMLIREEFLMNTNTPAVGSEYATADLMNGGYIMIWQFSNDFGFFSRRFDSYGNPVVPKFRITTDKSGQSDPSVSELSDARFVVTWDNTENGSDVDRHNIYCRIFDPDGEPVSNAFKVNIYTNSMQVNSTVTALADGGFYVIWETGDSHNSSGVVSGQRFDANGVRIGEEVTLSADSAFSPTVHGLPDGGYVLVSNSRASGTLGQRFDADGELIGKEFKLNEITTNSYNDTSICILPDGGIAATWKGYNAEMGGRNIYVRHFEAELWGTNREDMIIDSIGANWTIGQAGDDLLLGMDGDDMLLGGDRADTMTGNAGDDHMFGQSGSDIMDGGPGVDTMFGNRGDDTMEGGTGRDILNGGIGSDDLSGGDGADTLRGEAGNDALHGDTKRDILNGGAGDDTLHGGANNDQLIGNLGNDVLYGGTGNDRMFGNAGA